MKLIVSVYLILIHCVAFAGNENDDPSYNKGIKFTENKGQIRDQHFNSRPDILFSASDGHMTVFVRNDGISYQIRREYLTPEIEGVGVKGGVEHGKMDSLVFFRVDLNFEKSNPNPRVVFSSPIDESENFYYEHRPEGIFDVHSYKTVLVKNVWDGIDMRWYSKEGKIEYDFIVAIGANVENISYQIEGADEIVIEKEGALLINTPFGNIAQSRPIAFQGEELVRSEWRLKGNGVGFNLGHFNKKHKLVIDPWVGLRNWSTYYGGSQRDYFTECDIDDSSNVYVTGRTASSNIATTGAFQTSFTMIGGGHYSAFILKLDSSGQRQWATYYGSDFWNQGYDIKASGGFIYLCGRAETNSLFSTSGAFQSSRSTGSDGFLAKFNSQGQRIWGTYYGSSNKDIATGLEVDTSGNVYMVGFHDSTSSGMATSGSHQVARGGDWDGFLTKFNANGGRLWATYYGGSGRDQLWNVDLDGQGNIYAVGETESTAAISTSGSHLSSFAGGYADVFVVKFNNSGARQWASYYGGNDADIGYGICMDNDSSFYITGGSSSTYGIATTGAYQTSVTNSLDFFLAKFTRNGSLTWGTYYNSAYNNYGYDVGVDPKDNVYFCGMANNSLQSYGSFKGYTWWDDGALMKFTSSGDRLWAAYYGGAGDEEAWGLAIDPNTDKVVTTGWTSTSGNPFGLLASSGAQQTSLGGLIDGFVIRYYTCWLDTMTIRPASCDSFQAPSGKVISSSGSYFDTLTNQFGCDSIFFVQLILKQTPSVPSVTPGVVCDSGMVSLSASGSTGNYIWYEDSVGTTALDTSASIQTLILDSSKFYYVSALDSICESKRVPVQAIVMPTTITNISEDACQTYTTPSGKYTYLTNGTYQDTLQGVLGCDSILDIDLTIHQMADTSVTQDGKELTASADSAQYQWYDCNNKIIVFGSTGKNFIPKVNGSFAVIVTQYGCIDTSACFQVTTVGLKETGQDQISVYPNPTSSQLIVDFGEVVSSATLTLHNEHGQVVLEKTASDLELLYLDLAGFAKGIYSLSTQVNDRIYHQKVIKL
ncbi:MAG: T9SS type A sorting domain-containing protein [Vicingaceae bacterium]